MTDSSTSGHTPADKTAVGPPKWSPPGTSRHEEPAGAPPHDTTEVDTTWYSGGESDNVAESDNVLDHQGDPPHRGGPPQPKDADHTTPRHRRSRQRASRPSGADGPGHRTPRRVTWFESARRSVPTRLRRRHVVAAGALVVILAVLAVSAVHRSPAESSSSVATEAPPDAPPSAEPTLITVSPAPSPPPSLSPTPTPTPTPMPTPTKTAAATRPAPSKTPPRTSPAQASPTPSGLPALPTSSEACQKSVGGGAATVLIFRNERKATIRVYWVNHSGELERYRDVTPGESIVQGTYLGHPWVVTTEDDTRLACYLPTAAEATAVVR